MTVPSVDWSMFESGVEGEKFIGNYKIEYKPLLEQAIKDTKAAMIVRDTVTHQGNPDPLRVALHTLDRTSKQLFHQRFRELKEEYESKLSN